MSVGGGQQTELVTSTMVPVKYPTPSAPQQIPLAGPDVLKHVHPDIGISSNAMAVINSFMNDMLQKLAQESSWLAEYNKSPTITCREIEVAVGLYFPVN
ncbi:hypothetical protein M8C21_017242 [Ambrosia artemisiifolia]|uniref:Core Histone H2A/H2B/H3 domain-containing protein n=1 Tax=Ambrosia artemisiifolia TaxID=4212 RepID=A0AAD5CQT5_AMBAR|nr:hypothetical protein M8C21_017242 [Ambrosia artemisiifolia]